MIYFLQPVTSGPVKIGFTDDIERRHQQLESHYGCPLALLATLPGGRDEERAIHKRFAHLRFDRTEQFQPAPELMAFIGRPLLVDPNPDTVESMDPARNALTIKGSAEWKAWVERGAKHCLTDASKLADIAITRYLREQGFDETRPER